MTEEMKRKRTLEDGQDRVTMTRTDDGDQIPVLVNQHSVAVGVITSSLLKLVNGLSAF